MAEASQNLPQFTAMPTWEAPLAGTILVGPGMASHARIPVPGTKGLVLSLRPPADWRRTTSAIFIQNPQDKRRGKPSLRLDYGPNKARNNAIDYHWNIEGKTARGAFPGYSNHLSGGPGAEVLYRAAKAFRIGGNVFLLCGAVVDGVSILSADRPWRRGFQVVAAWEAAGILAERLGTIGAAVGSAVEPGGGTMVGGLAGSIVGGFIGYFGGQAASGVLYDWGEGTVFRSASVISVPSQ